MTTRLVCAVVVLVLGASLQASAENEIGWIEKFALAPDREAVLGQLLPGSEDYYFFHALHYQNTHQAAKLAAIMEGWTKRFPDSQRRRVIENRAALLGYDATPQEDARFSARPPRTRVRPPTAGARSKARSAHKTRPGPH